MKTYSIKIFFFSLVRLKSRFENINQRYSLNKERNSDYYRLSARSHSLCRLGRTDGDKNTEWHSRWENRWETRAIVHRGNHSWEKRITDCCSATIDPIVEKATCVRASRVTEQKKERKRERERERRLCVDPRQGYEAALRIRNRVYTNEVDGVRGEGGGTSFPSVSTTSERGREITGTRDRRIG